MTAAGFALSQSPTVRLSVAILSLATLPSGLASVAESVFIAVGRARVIALATTTENLLRTLIPIFLLYSGSSLPVICLSFVVMRLTACATYALIARHQLRALLSATWPLAREIAARTPTFAGVNILAAVHWQLGSVLVSRLGGDQAAAEYGVTTRFLVPATVLLASYASVIQPAASRLAVNSLPELGHFLSRCLRFVMALALPFAVGAIILGQELLSLLFGARYGAAWPALGLLAVSVIPFSLVMVAARGLIATGRQRFDLLGNFAAVAVNVALNFILIPRFGATGAAAAQLLSVGAMAAVEVYFGAKPLFSLGVWRAVWTCRTPLLVMTVVVWLANKADFLLALALGATSYLIGLALIRVRARQPYTPDSTKAEERQLRVLMVGSHTTKTLGGIATTISNLLCSPLAREFDFRHIASQADEYGKLGKIALAVAAWIKFVATLVWRQPDVVYIHVGANASLYRKVPFIAVARLLQFKVVTHFHAGDFDLYYQSRSRLGQALIRRGIGLSHHLIAVSENWEKRLRQMWPHVPVSVVPHGIKTDQFKRAPKTNGSSPRLLFVGAMGRLKGERDLISALQNILNLDPSLRLIMLGNGDETVKPLLRLAKLDWLVEHIGPVAMDQRADFYKRADLFVLPTYAECLPISMLEAMAAGLPIVSTTVGGIPDLIEDGVEGYLVAPGDVGALADRIARLINDPVERRRMGERARVKALRYDEGLALAQLGAQLRRAASGPGADRTT
jgi:glycosyltransferase involved in cell wall biosynthesis/O-antigen/teichoic acid export membrane protein